MRRILSSLLLAFVLFGCGDPPPKEGYIQTRAFEPAHWEDGYRTETYIVSECNTVTRGFGEDRHTTTQCGPVTKTRQVYEEEHEWINDRWWFLLQECKANKEGKMKCREGWLRVDETTFHRYIEGNHYPDPR